MSDETKTPAPEAGAPTPPAAPTLAAIPRTFEAIQKEYNDTARALGHLVWQLEIQKSQRSALFAKLNSLGEEASKIPPPPPAAPTAKKLAAVPPPPKAGSDGTA
jgi:hypothetical protein